MRAVLLAALVVSGAAWSARCGDLSDDDVTRMPLRGAGAFEVAVGLSDNATRSGLDLNKDSIKAAVELRLRRNAVKLGNGKLVPVLCADILVAASPERVVYSIELEFHQVVLVVATGQHCSAATWKRTRIGGCHPSQLRENVSDGLEELVDLFSNDFLAANEKVEAEAGR